MAYCVRCGVKLAAGSTECPLCKTPVIAPLEIVGEKQDPLFPPPLERAGRHEYQRLDKNRKGIIELVIAFMAIAVVTLVITAFALGAEFSPWLPIALVILGGSYILVLLFVKPTYGKIATWFAIITLCLLIIIDMTDTNLSWSLYANLSILLFWIVGVFPFIMPLRLRKHGYAIATVSIALFLIVIDLFPEGILSWSLTIALPTYAIVLIALAALVLRIRYGKPSITDMVLSVVLAACWGVVAGDFFHLRTINSELLLSWSSSVFIVAVCLLLFLTLNVTVRRVRNYFNNRLV